MMNKPGDELALRKEVVLARSSLCRLKIHYRAAALRHSISWRGAATAVAAAPPARAALFLLAAEGLGHERTARWLAYAGRALAAVRLTSLALGLLRKSP
jgi:hypothetical protein